MSRRLTHDKGHDQVRQPKQAKCRKCAKITVLQKLLLRGGTRTKQGAFMGEAICLDLHRCKGMGTHKGEKQRLPRPQGPKYDNIYIYICADSCVFVYPKYKTVLEQTPALKGKYMIDRGGPYSGLSPKELPRWVVINGFLSNNPQKQQINKTQNQKQKTTIQFQFRGSCQKKQNFPIRTPKGARAAPAS